MSTKPTAGVVTQLAIKDLTPDPNQPRKSYDQAALKEFSENIKACGIIEPITVRWDKGPVIVHGERRWRAAKLAGLKTAPCILVDDIASDDPITRSVRQIAENEYRESLAPLDVAEFLDNLRKTEKKTHNELVKALQDRGMKEAGHVKVRQLLDLVLLPDWAKTLLREDTLSETACQHIIPVLGDPVIMKELKKDIEDGVRWRSVISANDIRNSIVNIRDDIRQEEADKAAQQRFLEQEKKQDAKGGNGKQSAQQQRQETEEARRKNQRKTTLKLEKIEEYLDQWLRKKLIEIPPALPRGRLHALVLWMACAAPQDTPHEFGTHTQGERAHPQIKVFMRDWKLGDLPTFLNLKEDLEAGLWLDMARRAILTMNEEQLRAFGHWLQIDLLTVGFQIDEDYLALLRSPDLLKLAKVAQLPEVRGTMRQLKTKLLAPEAVKKIGVPDDVQKVYDKTPSAKKLTEIDVDLTTLVPPSEEDQEALGKAAAAAAKKKTSKKKAKGKAALNIKITEAAAQQAAAQPTSGCTLHHLTLDVQQFLLAARPEDYERTFAGEHGEPMDWHVAQHLLMRELELGHRFLPIGEECALFDYSRGCPGHPV